MMARVGEESTRASVPAAARSGDIPLSERYSRALRRTGPKTAMDTPGLGEEGYWLDESRYFFLSEKKDASVGGIVSVPAIADIDDQTIREVIPLESLVSLLSQDAAAPVDLKALSSAAFDMPDSRTLCVSVGTQHYRIDLERRIVLEHVSSASLSLYAPNGQGACFVKGFDLWLRELLTATELPLTNDGAAHLFYAQQSDSCLAAIPYRQSPAPVGLWSPDSQWFLTHRIDERTLPELALVEHVPSEGGRPTLHRVKYPVAGDPLPTATFVAVHVSSRRVVTFEDFPCPVLAYSPITFRMVWFGGSDVAWFLRTDRYWKHAELVRLDLAAGTGRVVLREEVSSGYVDFNPFMGATPNVRTLPASNEVIWFSERDGWGHLYLYDAANGVLKNQITQGQWLVRDVVDVDEQARRIFFLAGGIDPKTDPARRSLCAVNLDGTAFEVLVAHEGDVHVATTEPCAPDQYRPFRPSRTRPGISRNGRFAVVRYRSVTRGNQTKIVDLRTRHAFGIGAVLPDPDETLPHHFTVLASDGKTCLHGVMFFPSDFSEDRCYPLIDYVYPGPQAAQQPQSFRAMKSAQAETLAELGFITVMVDTRGAPVGSRAFHQAGYPELLEPQLSDHAALVRQLCQRFSFIDSRRVGVIGHSAGGAAAVRALCDYGDLFKAGVAACAYDDASFCTAMWSDKYRGPCDEVRWAAQANNSVAHKLRGKLMLICADMDENVPLSQTLSLASALIRANKDFDLVLVPNSEHSVLVVSGYAQRRAWDFLVRNLLGEAPPQDFEISFPPWELMRFARVASLEARQ